MLPLGYSFNLDGTMMYCTFASIFIAQTYHIEMSLGTQLAMLATLMITSKGVAGVPRASLVVIASTLSQFGIPEAGLLMIMGIDTFLDMGRSATNVIGNSLATAVVAKWEGELKAEHELGPDDAVPSDAVAGRCIGRPLTGAMHASIAGEADTGGRSVAGSMSAGNGGASADDGSEGLSPTLANIKNSHTVRLGYRESSPPFSFLDHSNRPIGYSLELCEAIVEEIGVEVDDANLKIEYVKVTSDDRIPAVVAEQDRPRMRIDHGECRARQAGGVLAADVRRRHQADGAEEPRRSRRVTDLKGKTVVVTKGTTNEQAMHNADKKFSLGLNIVTAADHEQSYQMLVDGKADAFATDDILLYGLIARHKAQDKFKVVGDYLSYDPYGIMFRKGEPQLTAVVERTFRKLGSNRDLIPLYNKWFVVAAADRRAAQRPDLAAARGSLQGARRHAGDEQLVPVHPSPPRKRGPIATNVCVVMAGATARCNDGHRWLSVPAYAGTTRELMRAALQPKTLSSAALYAACTSSGCSRPSASIFTPEFTSRICQASPTRTTSIDPKRMPIACAARIAS